MRLAASMLACALALGGAGGCGADGPAPIVSMSFAVTAATAAKIRQFQVSFLKTSLDCASVMHACVKSLGATTVPVASGAPAFVADYTQGQASVSMSIDVAAGTYMVVVEALDEAGKVVANQCALDVELSTANPRGLGMKLEEAAGSCDGRL